MRNVLSAFLGTILSTAVLFADDVVRPGTPVLDRPTLTSLGIRLPVGGDDNFNAAATVRYRAAGTNSWAQGLPLYRTHPEHVTWWTAAKEFAGSIFDLRPNTTYDIEITLNDPNGRVNQTFKLSGATRPIPSDPATPREISVRNQQTLRQAIASAQPGDVITLADGVYSLQSLSISANGTDAQPIVIRGSSEEGTIIDGQNCGGCNILEVYSSNVHIENLTLRNAQRAIRFQTAGTSGNVVRRVHIKNTTMGIGGRENQFDYYIADNILEGRLQWPNIYTDDGAARSGDTGIAVTGHGHVVAHNQISGYGDAMRNEQNGARSLDFYGNDVRFTYDNALELDTSEGNVRAFRNRFANTYMPISMQPVRVGPAYIFRNVVVNNTGQPLKFYALGTVPAQEPNGIFVFNNTFQSPVNTLYMGSPAASHHFRVMNNVFVGPWWDQGRAVLWDGPIDDGMFDYNGYLGTGWYNFKFPNGYSNYRDFNALKTGNRLEMHGVSLTGTVFANAALTDNYRLFTDATDFTLVAGSPALDAGTVLPNISDNFKGSGPDLGAVETGCPAATYGPRPIGIDESNATNGCGTKTIDTNPTSPAPVPQPPAPPASNPGSTIPAPGTWVNIVAKHSGKCMDVSGVSTAPAAAILQWDCHGGANQSFQIVPVNGGFKIIAKHSGLGLDVNGGPRSVYDGATLIQYQFLGGANQTFNLQQTNDGYFSIVANHSGKCLDVEGGPAAIYNGTTIMQYSYVGGDNQKWSLVPAR